MLKSSLATIQKKTPSRTAKVKSSARATAIRNAIVRNVIVRNATDTSSIDPIQIAGGLAYNNETVYEFMFKVLDTAHDIFDRKTELSKKFGPGFFNTIGIPLKDGGKNDLQRIDTMLRVLYNVNGETMQTVNQIPITPNKRFNVHRTYKANSFTSWWKGFIEYQAKGLTLGDIKESLIKNQIEVALMVSYNLHTEVRKSTTYSIAAKTISYLKFKSAIQSIFSEYALHIAEDALKGSLAVDKILTPAILLDPATTTNKVNYLFLLVDCKLTQLKDETDRNMYIEVTFNNLLDQQLACQFEMRLHFYKPSSNNRTDTLYMEAMRIYKELTVLTTTNKGFTTHKVDNVSIAALNYTLQIFCYPKHAKEWTNKVKHSPLLTSTGANITLKHTYPAVSRVLKETGCNTPIYNNGLTGMSVNDCLSRIEMWTRHEYKAIEDKSEANRMKQKIVQLYMDVKRMGDSFQVTYLHRYYQKRPKTMHIYPYFASQDILAVYQAMSVHRLLSKTSNQVGGVPFVFNVGSGFNTQGASITYLMGTPINSAVMKHISEIYTKTLRLRSNRKRAAASEDMATRQNHVIHAVKYASKYDNTRQQNANNLLNGTNPYLEIANHLTKLSSMSKAERLKYLNALDQKM